MRAGQHHRSEALLTGVDAALTELVVLAAAILAQKDYPYDSEMLDNILELIVETVCTKRPLIRIGAEERPAEIVRSRFMKLNVEHIRYATLGGEYTDYDIPGEALTDTRFANMIREAEKYLGYPYVWGGSSPSTSFDCSGFVS